jgi:sulfate transport system ATP-binding protein
MQTQSPPPDTDKETKMDALNTEFRPGNGEAVIASAASRWREPISVTVENVARAFGETPALGGVSLEIAPGELVALLGPSGSGKTTLLRILAGLDFPDSGRVLFGGEDALSLPVQKRQIGFVFQQYALFRHMTVFDNVAFGLTVRPMRTRPPKAEIRDRVMDLLSLVQLDGYDKRYPAQLSGGQRQRVALARALAADPRVLLLDEPFGALDAQVRRDLRRWLRELHDRTGHTTVFVTHDQEEALELADRVVVIRDGKVEQVGTPDEIYDSPATPFVASFIGEANLIPTSLSAGRIHFEGEALAIAPSGVRDGKATMMVRPHDFGLATSPIGALTGTIIGNRRSGAKRRLEVALGKDRHAVEIELPADDPVPQKREIHLKPERWRLFPA